jgi:D-amino-acid dehydrogenase
MSDVLVLGAGMVGVSTALALQAIGRDVVLVDRKAPGRETSYGNVGIIQSEAVEPYALPRDIPSLTRIALKRGNDVNYHLDALPQYVRPLWLYYWFSAPERHKVISRSYAKLAQRSTADHQPLIEASGADALIRRTGMRFLFHSERTLGEGIAEANRISAEYGVPMRVMDGADVAAAEPALKIRLAGAVHWTSSWSCADPGGLTEAYAKLFVSRGGTLVGGDAMTLAGKGHGWTVDGPSGPISARDAVVALGPWSGLLLERFGYNIPLFRKKGYHRHFKGGATLSMPILDRDHSFCLAPMRAGMRVNTGAEIARFDARPTPKQLARSEAIAAGMLDLGEPVEAEPWTGHRPCMPDMLPLVGRAPRHEGLWFHFGHGHQGFTQGPTTSALLAEEMQTGKAPMPELSPSRLAALGGA